MSGLAKASWRPHYTPDSGDLVEGFYVPALSCAERYDRSTGYFTASALALAMRGIESLFASGGRMRLLVGCTLNEAEVSAIERGQSLRDTVEGRLMAVPLVPPDHAAREALEVLAWMIARGILEVKVAVPCDDKRRPIPGIGLFHAKAGIIEDNVGDRLAFNGSINETESGWRHNYETFHVYTSWNGGERHVDAEEREFQTLWSGNSRRALVMDIPAAKRQELLQFLPKDDKPARLNSLITKKLNAPEMKAAEPPAVPALDPRKVIWSFIRLAPSLPEGGEGVGEATSAVTPWPHQIRAFERMYRNWPPKLLIADEVGLGKTIQAGMVLRQAWISGKAKRILVMAPKGVLKQWQIELREKFNLNWPIYDGNRLVWQPCPALGREPMRSVDRASWHQEPCVIVSSHLMRRVDRARELLQEAAPWDLVVLDEAHHARRRGGGLGLDERPNQMLRLMRQLTDRTAGLILLTATPMQVSPIEVWDLLALLGLPSEWSAERFVQFFETVAKPNPSHAEMAGLARLYRSVEAHYGPTDDHEAKHVTGVTSTIRLKRLLRALRDQSSIPIRQLETEDRRALLKLLKATTPVRHLISRHTRRLLRRYYEAGKISARIAERHVEDRFVELSAEEARVYAEVEDYISTTYNNSEKERKTAVGFVMTIYRRRLSSSFHSLARTLEARLEALRTDQGTLFDENQLEEDLLEDEAAEEVMDTEDAERLELQALAQEERGDIEDLLKAIRRLPTDTKAKALLHTIHTLRDEGFPQVMVFTQYTDTMDFLRDFVVKETALELLCFSGRGGEVRSADGGWTAISRDETKRRFRDQRAQVMLCTDAAAEGLNFQFCGAMVNYDMPWNPMRVEQRIGRIDRLGQAYPRICIVNLHYQDTVEADVYVALRRRIKLFETFVGGLQPILARLPKAIQSLALARDENRGREKADLVDCLVRDIDESPGFELDEITEGNIEEQPRARPAYTLAELGGILAKPALLPPGDEVKAAGSHDFSLLRPGMSEPIRITTDAAYYEQHSDSVELWSPGSPLFPEVNDVGGEESVTIEGFRRVLASGNSISVGEPL